MERHRHFLWTLLALVLATAKGAAVESGEVPVPGRPVVVAAAAIGCGGAYTEKMDLAVKCLHAAGAAGADIVCLPEEFSGGAAESVPGPTTGVVATLAKEYGMYVVCPLVEQAGDREYNTAVLIDRAGDIAGRYRKIFVFWGENRHAGEAGVPCFDTDFGRIAILTCFDLNYPELWREASDQGAEIVFWPSAYGGGFPLKGYAGIHAYCVVSVGNGDFIDMTGEGIPPASTPMDRLHIATLDLDRTLVHKDFNREKVAALLEAHRAEITLERDWDPEGWYMLRAVKPGVRVRDLCRGSDIENLWEYRLRSREQINARRAAGLRIGANRRGIPLGTESGASDGPDGVAPWVKSFAGRLAAAWRRGQPMPQLCAAHPDATLAEAYAVQRCFVAEAFDTGPIAGYKAAGVASLEADHPLVGVIPDSIDYADPGEIVVDLNDGAPRHVETEIGYRFHQAVTAPVDTVDALRTCVDAVAAVIEVPGGAVEAFRPVTGTDLVAWNINGKCMIVGPGQDPTGLDPDTVDITLTLNGEVINTARGDMAAAGQWPTLLKTVNHLLAQGYVIAPGQVISNGALGKINRARAGNYQADFGVLGKIEFEAR